MEILRNEPLAKHVTMRIGGTAERFCLPESEQDIEQLIRTEKVWRVLSGGSNVLINDEIIFPCVISMSKACRAFEVHEDGTVYVGASLRIQEVIRRMGELNQGGFEFLYSLPALMGGVIYMNAGRGSDKKSISEFIVDVRVMDREGNVHVLPKEACEFSFRKSCFQHEDWIVLGATLRGASVPQKESQKQVEARVLFCKGRQDMRYPNFGSVFSKNDGRILRVVRMLSKFDHAKVRFSDITPNWLLNEGNGTYKQACKKIEQVKKIHRLFKRKCECEVIIWEA